GGKDECGTCIFLQAGASLGYCLREPYQEYVGQAPTGLDAFGPVSYRDGGCESEGTLRAKAQACCQALPGVDCRAWPFAHTSRHGELCSVHADCELGLLCVTGDAQGPRCMCPGESADEFPPSACGGLRI